MELLKVDTIEYALEKLLKAGNDGDFKLETCEVDIFNMQGKILAEDIISNVNVPGFDRSIVDGYAVKYLDTMASSDAIPTFLKVVGESVMGKSCEIELNSGEAIYVPTGGMLPKGADAVIMVEYSEKFGTDEVAIYAPGSKYLNVVTFNSDVKMGEKVLKKGRKLTIGDIGVLASIGIEKVKVYKPFSIHIISTGDEIVSLGDTLKDGKVRDVNTYTLFNLAKSYGFRLSYELVKDEKDELRNAIESHMAESDVVVLSGGSSKGKKDYAVEVINSLSGGQILTHGIALRPGKPTITAFDKKTKTFLIGLPGHPVASVFVFKEIVYGLYQMLTGNRDEDKYVYAKMLMNIPQSPGRKTIMLVNLVNINDEVFANPILAESGIISSLSAADGYITIDMDTEGIKKGDKVKVTYI